MKARPPSPLSTALLLGSCVSCTAGPQPPTRELAIQQATAPEPTPSSPAVLQHTLSVQHTLSAATDDARLARRPTGTLDEAAVKKTIHRHQNEVRFCIENDLEVRAPAAAKLRVEATLRDTGSVSNVDVLERSDDMPKPIECCLAQAVRRWTFPAPKGGRGAVVSFWLQR